MIVTFPTVTSRSGSDVYFDLLARVLAANGIETRPVALSHRHEFIPFLSASERAAIAAGDVVHTAGEHGALVHIPGKPLVLTLHHNVIDADYRPYTSFAQRLFHYVVVHGRQRRALALAARAVCVSESTRLSYARAYPEHADKLQVIYNGVDTSCFCPAEVGSRRSEVGGRKSEVGGRRSEVGSQKSDSEDAPLRTPPSALSTPNSEVLFVGHMTRRKGADLLPGIMDRLGPGFVLTCIGLRNNREQETVTPSGARIRVRPPVGRDELVALYRRCAVLLFPSRLEGFGYAAAEAMACGRPVVAARSSSLPELVEDGKGGFLCPPDDVAAFADALRRVCSSPTLARAMGAFNRTRAVERFGLDRMGAAYAKLYGI